MWKNIACECSTNEYVITCRNKNFKKNCFEKKDNMTVTRMKTSDGRIVMVRRSPTHRGYLEIYNIRYDEEDNEEPEMVVGSRCFTKEGDEFPNQGGKILRITAKTFQIKLDSGEVIRRSKKNVTRVVHTRVHNIE